MDSQHEVPVPLGSPLRARLSVSDEFAADAAKKQNLMKKMSIVLAATSLDEDVKEKVAPIYIVAFLYFDEPISVTAIRSLIKERLLELPRFKSLAVKSTEGKKEVYSFRQLPTNKVNMDELVQEISGVKTPDDLNRFTSSIYSSPMSLEHPLWRCYVINQMDDGRSLLCWAIDHSIADGTGLVAVLMSILDDQAPAEVPKRRPAPSPGCFTSLRACLGACFNVMIGDQLPGDPKSKLKMKDHRKPTREKAMSTSPGIPLSDIKALQSKFPGSTINDVLMTMVCLTLREYFAKYEPGVLERKQKLRANFPVSLRKSGEDSTNEENLRNRFAPGTLTFPMHISDPCTMLRSIKSQIDVVKVSPEPMMRDKIMGLLFNSGLKKGAMWDLVLDMYGKVTVMLSNVPGPQQQVSLGGKPISDITFYALAPIGLYFGITSYNGRINCGICVSAECEPNAEKLSELWKVAFELLSSAAPK